MVETVPCYFGELELWRRLIQKINIVQGDDPEQMRGHFCEYKNDVFEVRPYILNVCINSIEIK